MAMGKKVLLFSTSLLPFYLQAADISCNTTLYYCGVGNGDNVSVVTKENEGIRPLQGHGIYLNNSKYFLNNISVTTTGEKADAIRGNGNNGSIIESLQGKIVIKTSGQSADGINLGVRGGYNYKSTNIAYLMGSGGEIEASGIGVRANNNVHPDAVNAIILGDGFGIKQTDVNTDNNFEGIGYAVYAGNRDNDNSDYGLWDTWVNNYRNNNKGKSYVFIGDNSVIQSNGKNFGAVKGAAVYANKGGVVQLGDNATVDAPVNVYRLFSSTEKQNIGSNNPGETAEARPGTILLNGGVVILKDSDGTPIADPDTIILHSKGKDSVIANGKLDYSYDSKSVTFTPAAEVQEAQGKYAMKGTLLASEQGKIALNMSVGSYFYGRTNQIDSTNGDGTIVLNIDGVESVWQLADDSSLSKLVLTGAGALYAYKEAADGTLQALKIQGDVTNSSGEINLVSTRNDVNVYKDKDIQDSSKMTTLTIAGNYIGGSTQPNTAVPYPTDNGLLTVNTIWNADDSSYSDKLRIEGTAEGYTKVQTSKGIIGDVALSHEKYSVNVVEVADTTTGGNPQAFYGFADTQGAKQAVLVEKNPGEYAWYLPAATVEPPVKPEPPVEPPVKPEPPVEPPVKPEPPVEPPVKPEPRTPDKPEVPGVALMPRINLEQGYAMVSTLHERVSEQNHASDGQEEQVWGRWIGNKADIEGKNQYEAKSRMWGLQFGRDLVKNENPDDKSVTHAGVMLSYIRNNLSFSDRETVYFDEKAGSYQVGHRDSGRANSRAIALGAYRTYYKEDGSYLDLIANVDYTINRYKSNRNFYSKNKSYGLVLSAEIGKPYPLIDESDEDKLWTLEPQAQIVYQARNFEKFKSENSIDIDQRNRHGLRGRLGVRLAKTKFNDKFEFKRVDSFYITANLLRDLSVSNKSTFFGADMVSEKVARNFAEFGLGGQVPVNKSSYMYMDGRYLRSIGKSNGTMSSYRFNIGLKYIW